MNFLKKIYADYRAECYIVIVSGALVCSIIYFGYRFFQQNKIKAANNVKTPIQSKIEPSEKKPELEKSQTEKHTIIVDISGAVKNPGAYSMSDGDRLDDILETAGGLSSEADRDFFYRNFNKAAVLFDEQKIYIPRQDEVQQGIFVEGRYVIGLESPQLNSDPTSDSTNVSNTSSDKISINTASQDDLESLTGIGEVTAKKIIDNRVYSSINDLLEKKILSQKVFDGLKDQISL